MRRAGARSWPHQISVLGSAIHRLGSYTEFREGLKIMYKKLQSLTLDSTESQELRKEDRRSSHFYYRDILDRLLVNIQFNSGYKHYPYNYCSSEFVLNLLALSLMQKSGVKKTWTRQSQLILTVQMHTSHMPLYV